MIPPGITAETHVHILSNDFQMGCFQELDNPELWSEIIAYQIDQPNRNIDKWERLTQHVETFNVVAPHLASPDGDIISAGWGDARKKLYESIRIELARKWFDAFLEQEKQP